MVKVLIKSVEVVVVWPEKKKKKKGVDAIIIDYHPLRMIDNSNLQEEKKK